MSEPEGLDTGQALPTHDANAKGEGRLIQEGRSSLQHQYKASSPSVSDDADASSFSGIRNMAFLILLKHQQARKPVTLVILLRNPGRGFTETCLVLTKLKTLTEVVLL